MEGSPDDIPASSEKKDDKKAKKSETAFGLGKSSFEFSNKKDKAEKIAEAPVWEKLIPKEGVEKPAAETKIELPTVETGEEVADPTVEKLSQEETAEVVKDYAQEKVAELEAGRSESEDPAEAAVREANIEFLHEIEVAPESIPLEPVEVAPDTADEALDEVEDGPAEFEHGQEINFIDAAENADTTDSEDEPSQQATQTTAAAPPPVPPVKPPVVPGAVPTPPGGGTTFNVAPLNANPNVVPPVTRVEYVRDRRSEGAYFLAGGILGYLLGRRRGRIKTEKRMNVVKKKLEKQITDVRQQVARQEVTIREQARERFNETHARTEAPRGAETATKITMTEVVTNRRKAAEQLGVSEVVATATAERVQSMDHREVLAVAEKVVIDGTSLRTIYESKQITEPGLRRLTREYLRGGDLKAALKQELQVKEMQYEKDPQMRDRLAASYAGVDAAEPMTATESMATFMEQGGEPNKSPMHHSVQQAEADTEVTKARGEKILISAWAVLLVVLVIVAVVLAAR